MYSKKVLKNFRDIMFRQKNIPYTDCADKIGISVSGKRLDMHKPDAELRWNIDSGWAPLSPNESNASQLTIRASIEDVILFFLMRRLWNGANYEVRTYTSTSTLSLSLSLSH